MYLVRDDSFQGGALNGFEQLGFVSLAAFITLHHVTFSYKYPLFDHKTALRCICSTRTGLLQDMHIMTARCTGKGQEGIESLSLGEMSNSTGSSVNLQDRDEQVTDPMLSCRYRQYCRGRTTRRRQSRDSDVDDFATVEMALQRRTRNEVTADGRYWRWRMAL